MSDIRSALRSLLKNPGLTAAAVLSLGLGIGANTTIFAWVQAVLFRPIPVAADPGSLFVAAMESREGQGRGWSYPNYRDFRDRATLVDFVAQDDQIFNFAVNGVAERASGGIVSGNYFQVMGIRPAVGRLFTPDDDKAPGGHPVAVLSYAFWQQRFAGDPATVGRQVSINNVSMTIIGVAAEHFTGSFLGIGSWVWVPMAMQREVMGSARLEARGSGWMNTIVRLKPGVSRAQAQAQINSVMTQLEGEFREINDGRRVKIVNMWEAPFGASSVLAPILGVLSVLVALVLVIACANVANLLLSKAVSRRREVAVRLSLGASRWRLVRQLLTEAILLSSLAGALGVAMAYWTMGLLMAFAPPVDVPIDLGIHIDTTTLVYALVVSMITGLVFGLAPALQSSSPETVHALKEEGRGSGGRTNQRLRNALVVAQVAVCLILLVGATLFLRSFQKAQAMSPGFDPSHLAMASFDLFPSGYTGEKAHEFRTRAIAAVDALPGVVSAAFATRVPLSLGSNNSMGLAIGGYVPRPNEEVNITYIIVGPRYFETMGVPVLHGREFTGQDTKDTPERVVINDAMAKRYWPNGNAIGGQVRIGPKNVYEVIGVTADMKYAAINERPRPQLFLSMAHNNVSTSRMVLRTTGDPGPMVASVRDAIRALDPNLPLYDLRTITEHMKTAVFAQRLAANLLGAMGVLALLLASIGLYGVMAYAVSQRTQEMGIRLALGASPGALLSMVVKQGMGLTSIGLIIGLAVALGAFGSVGAVRTLLPGISPLDPITFVAVPVVLAAIACLASWIPARRAGKVDPIVALRYE